MRQQLCHALSRQEHPHATRFAQAGCARERKNPPRVWEVCAAGGGPVALVDNERGGSHCRPGVAHLRSLACLSTTWLAVSQCGLAGWTLTGLGTGLDERLEEPVILARLRVPLHGQLEA